MQGKLDSFLKTGTIFAFLNTFGKVPFVTELFISVDRGTEIDFLIILRIFVGMLLGPVLLLFFIVLIMSHISCGLIGFIKKLLLFGVFRYFIIFSSRRNGFLKIFTNGSEKEIKVFSHLLLVCGFWFIRKNDELFVLPAFLINNFMDSLP